MLKKEQLTLTALVVPLALSLTGCGATNLLDDSYDKSVEKTSETSAAGVASGLLPKWLPAGGTNVQLVQRSTGNERILSMDYTGVLPAGQCTPLQAVGNPHESELASAYASDQRTKNTQPEDIADYRTLEADWWPEDAEARTTDLCGRWWVHLSDGKLYAFAPDGRTIADNVRRERNNS